MRRILSNKKVIILLGVIVLFIAILVLASGIIRDTPKSEEKILEEVKNKIEDICGEEVLEASIISRTTGEEKDTILISVTSANDKVEHKGTYVAYYQKDKKGWSYQFLEEYLREEWEVRPISAPSVEELLEECSKHLQEYSEENYDEVIPSTTPANVDLEKGIATYFYEVKKNGLLKNISGDMEFLYEFDVSSEKWVLKNFNYSDSYKIDYEVSYSWNGEEKNRFYGNKTFQLSILNEEEGVVTAEFYENGKKHQMNGKINKNLGIEILEDGGKAYCIKGTFDEETGDFKGMLYRNYSENKTFYVGEGSGYSNLELVIQK